MAWLLASWGMVKTSVAVTIDDQQPILALQPVGCRSQTNIVVGIDNRHYPRYSRAERLAHSDTNFSSTQIYSPFRRWTCGRIINTYPRYQPMRICFHLSLCKLEWIGTSRGKLMWTSSGVGLPGISVREKSQTNNCIFYARHQFLSITLIFTSWSEVIERETNYNKPFSPPFC